MSDLVTRLSVLAEDDGDRYPTHVKKLAEAAASRIAALEAKLAERTGGVNEDALRALAQAYDREDAAQRGEPDPWNLDDPGDIGDSDTWVSERLGCARAAAEAFLSALTTEPAAPEGRQEAVEELAAFLCSEFDFDLDPVTGASWPEHEKDDGYRGNGYVRLQPSDVQARARENATRILTFISQITRPAEQAVTEAKPFAFCVHDFHVARMPVKARGKFEEPTEYYYPASRENDARETARLMGATCTPLYAGKESA